MPYGQHINDLLAIETVNDVKAEIHLRDLQVRKSAEIHCVMCHALYTLCEQSHITPTSRYVSSEYAYLRDHYTGGREFVAHFEARMANGSSKYTIDGKQGPFDAARWKIVGDTTSRQPRRAT
jgi:hypothetical protein